jgi:hypothetical protein
MKSNDGNWNLENKLSFETGLSHLNVGVNRFGNGSDRGDIASV